MALGLKKYQLIGSNEDVAVSYYCLPEMNPIGSHP